MQFQTSTTVVTSNVIEPGVRISLRTQMLKLNTEGQQFKRKSKTRPRKKRNK